MKRSNGSQPPARRISSATSRVRPRFTLAASEVTARLWAIVLSPRMNAQPATRTVLVTGAAKRLGREIALALAAAGWQVAVHYRSSSGDAARTVDDCRSLAPQLRFDSIAADLADEAQVRALVPQVIARFGALDGVVNSASLFEHDSVRTFGAASLQAHMGTNTVAPILLAQALHEHVAARSARGAVVNLLDHAGTGTSAVAHHPTGR